MILARMRVATALANKMAGSRRRRQRRRLPMAALPATIFASCAASWLTPRRTIEPGRAAGCLTIFVDCRYKQESAALPDKIVGSLSEAADFILETEQRVADRMRAVV
jgi:hypothetical protein